MKKFLFSLFLALAASAAGADNFVCDGIAYNLVEDGCEATYSPGVVYSGDMVIPSHVTYGDKEYAVVGIAAYTFAGSEGLMEIKLPETLDYVGRNAFQGCSSLTSVTFPERVKRVNEQTFYGCSALVSFKGVGIADIGVSAFSGCTMLSDVETGMLAYIADGGFKGCRALERFDLPEGCRLGNGVFSGCSALRQAVLPQNITVLPEYTFSDCVALTSVGNTSQLIEIGDYAFSACRSLQNFKFGRSIERIGRGAFGFCTDLSLDSICGAEATISPFAFTGCNALQELTLVGVVEIGEEAFSNAAELKKIIFNPEMKYIRERAFRNCRGIEFIGCYALQPPFMANNSFMEEVYRNAELNVLYGKSLLYRQSPPWSLFLSVTELPEDDITGVEPVAEVRSSFHIEGNKLTVTGSPEIICIYDLRGVSLFQDSAPEECTVIELPGSGIYLVTIDSSTFKIFVK